MLPRARRVCSVSWLVDAPAFSPRFGSATTTKEDAVVSRERLDDLPRIALFAGRSATSRTRTLQYRPVPSADWFGRERDRAGPD